ncbi:hypothetical protein ABIB58_001519 [Brevundimonas sp. UYEF29]|uniref:lasso peptide biosynthesis B2 protein n=1 Tax=Brevundimonas TaxID=41275 RepID=UPI0033911CA6
MTVDLWCHPDIFLAVVDEDVVILDVAGDRYDCLLGAAALLKLKPDGSILPVSDLVAEGLRDAGLAGDAPLGAGRRPPIPPMRELTPAPEPPRLEIARAALAWIVATALFRGKPLSVLAEFHRALRGRAIDQDEVRLAHLAGAARRVRPWIPFEGECLQRSFQLRCYLASRGVASDWIFGVRTWPFSAHCWLQIGDLVVGDRLARVRRYTPILRA